MCSLQGYRNYIKIIKLFQTETKTALNLVPALIRDIKARIKKKRINFTKA